MTFTGDQTLQLKLHKDSYFASELILKMLIRRAHFFQFFQGMAIYPCHHSLNPPLYHLNISTNEERHLNAVGIEITLLGIKIYCKLIFNSHVKRLREKSKSINKCIFKNCMSVRFWPKEVLNERFFYMLLFRHFDCMHGSQL